MSTVDPQDVIRKYVCAPVLGAVYPRELPPELAPWYCATRDSGHCIAVAVHSLAGDPIDPDECLVALCVKTVLRIGWTTRAGYVLCDVAHGPSGAGGWEDGDEEFDGLGEEFEHLIDC